MFSHCCYLCSGIAIPSDYKAMHERKRVAVADAVSMQMMVNGTETRKMDMSCENKTSAL